VDLRKNKSRGEEGRREEGRRGEKGVTREDALV
jgi:hypothetical protein